MSQSPYPTIAAGPPRPSLILRPGQIALPPGMERYTIQGNGAVLIEVEAGDTFTVRNVEGGQACELLAWDKSGVIDPSIFGEKSNSNAAGIKALLAEGDDSLASVRHSLERRQVQIDRAKAVRVFGGATPAGTEQAFTIARDGAMLIAAPGGPMLVDGHDTATPLAVIVRRATVRLKSKSELADPLADLVLDLRVHSATAESYFVKAGDYLQIIDVDGRQCTDFQCFSARKLDKGHDHPLDVTTTRTLMGSSYPMRGLHSKYYDQDMEPVVEVV